jgi:hypothetical protein
MRLVGTAESPFSTLRHGKGPRRRLGDDPFGSPQQVSNVGIEIDEVAKFFIHSRIQKVNVIVTSGGCVVGFRRAFYIIIVNTQRANLKRTFALVAKQVTSDSFGRFANAKYKYCI